METAMVLSVLLIFCAATIVSGEDWEDVGSCGVGLKCGPDCQRLCLIQHNYYRSLHNSPPLRCDPQLARSAQDWADSNAFDGTVQRSRATEDFVESISWKKWGWEGMGTKEGAIPGAVRSWYSEIKNAYNYGTGEGNGTVAHFKSVVHSHETRLGCGINIKPGDGTYVVAHYALEPSDKFKLSDFTPIKKVGRRNKPEPQCDIKSNERQQCGYFKSPYVTPDKCIQVGCCYDDIFFDEPKLQWHSDKASIWCFHSKGRMHNKFVSHPGSSTSVPEGGSAPEKGLAPLGSRKPSPFLSPSSAPGATSLQSGVPFPAGASSSGPAAQSADASGNCGITFGQSCYTFGKVGETWEKNRKTCQNKGGDLISMETEEEWKFTNDEIQKLTNPTANEWHIGLKKNGNAGWKWVNGKPLTIEKWQRFEPSGDGPYVVMSKDYPPGSRGLFNDLPDWLLRGFICEKPKGIAPGNPQPGGSQPTTAPALGGSTQPGGGGTTAGGQKPTTPPATGGSTQTGGGATTAGGQKPTTPPATGGSTQPGGGATTAAPTPSGGGEGETSGMTGFQKDCLEAHNKYRAKHGTPPLTWSNELTAQAQEWANHLAVINRMEHDMESIESKGVGENVAYFQPGDPNKMPGQCHGPKTPDCVQCREMVADWYAEEKNYDYNTGESKGGVILHFTQVVWKDTTELGMATATSANKFFTVARYKPRGNFGFPSDFKKNVPPKM